MDNIYYDGNLKASLTVGSVSDINPLNAYTKDQVNELLGEKSDVNHTHEQYLTEHQSLDHLALKDSIKGLATEEYVNNQIDNIDIPEVDLSNCATKEELNEVKQSVSEGKKLLASAITDMGVDTLATDTWETMVENILNINPYYIEYTVIPSGKNDILDNYKYIPNIKNIGDADFHRNYDGVRITLRDGSITKDLHTLVTDVEKIRIYYNARTEQLKFRGSLYDIVYIKTVDYLKTDNFTNLGNMFQGCSFLKTINTNEWVINSSVTNLSSIFYGCNSLKKLDLSNWNTANIKTLTFMLSGVPTDVDWCYDGTNYANWTLTEEQTGFSGTFPWNKQEEENPYYIEFTVGGNEPVTYEELFFPIIEHVDYIIAYGNEGVVFDSRKDDLSDENKPSNISVVRGYYNAETERLSFSGNNYINGVNYCRVPVACDLHGMFSYCGRIEYLNLSNWEFDDAHSVNMDQMFYYRPLKYLNLMNWGTLLYLDELTDCYITAEYDDLKVNAPSYPTFVDYIPVQNSKYDMLPVGDILTPVKDLTGEGYTTEVILHNGVTMTLSDAIDRRKYYGEIHFIRQYYDPAQYGKGQINDIFGDNYDNVESILYLDTKDVTELYNYFDFEPVNNIKYITPVLDFSNVTTMESLVGGTIPEGLIINIANSKPNEAIHGSNSLLGNASKKSLGTLILPAGVFDLSKMSNTPDVKIIEVE